MSAVPVRELELDLDAFEGPFDLLLSLVLREELPLAELDLAQIVVAVAAFVWVQRRGREIEPRRPKRAAPPPGPKMAVPRGRVR